MLEGKGGFGEGIPMHYDRWHRAEGDERRHRARCVYYDNNFCKERKVKCGGSAHCEFYSEEYELPNSEYSYLVFDGIKVIMLEDIIVDSDKFEENTDEINKHIEYFKSNGYFSVPIYVSHKKNDYILEDKYQVYVAAKKLGLVEIFAKYGNKRDAKEEDEYRAIGKRISNTIHGCGSIIDYNYESIFVEFDNGKRRELNLYTCIEKRLIKLL